MSDITHSENKYTSIWINNSTVFEIANVRCKAIGCSSVWQVVRDLLSEIAIAAHKVKKMRLKYKDVRFKISIEKRDGE